MKISKKMMVRMALFVALTGAAMLLDVYFEDHPVKMEQTESTGRASTGDQGIVCLIQPVISSYAKTAGQKLVARKFLMQSHDKLLQKYHQARNYLALKTEFVPPAIPIILSLHHLTFKGCYFTSPDDDPMIS